MANIYSQPQGSNAVSSPTSVGAGQRTHAHRRSLSGHDPTLNEGTSRQAWRSDTQVVEQANDPRQDHHAAHHEGGQTLKSQHGSAPIDTRAQDTTEHTHQCIRDQATTMVGNLQQQPQGVRLDIRVAHGDCHQGTAHTDTMHAA